VNHKYVEYDTITGDYAAYLDGDIVGFYPTRQAAQAELDAIVFKRLQATGKTDRERRENAPLMPPGRMRVTDDLFKEED
jgi:hypothetical protein